MIVQEGFDLAAERADFILVQSDLLGDTFEGSWPEVYINRWCRRYSRGNCLGLQSNSCVSATVKAVQCMIDAERMQAYFQKAMMSWTVHLMPCSKLTAELVSARAAGELAKNA